MHAKHLPNFYKKLKHSLFTPLISKNEYDKPNIKKYKWSFTMWKMKHSKSSCSLAICKWLVVIKKLKTVVKLTLIIREKKNNTRNFKLKKKKTSCK